MTEAALLNSMSSKFNAETDKAEGESLVNLDLTEDKTLKWRTMRNNQYASKDKRKSQLNDATSLPPATTSSTSLPSVGAVVVAATSSTSSLNSQKLLKNNLQNPKFNVTLSTKDQQQKKHRIDYLSQDISKDSMETDNINKSTIYNSTTPATTSSSKTKTLTKSTTRKTTTTLATQKANDNNNSGISSSKIGSSSGSGGDGVGRNDSGSSIGNNSLEENEKAVEENFKALIADDEDIINDINFHNLHNNNNNKEITTNILAKNNHNDANDDDNNVALVTAIIAPSSSSHIDNDHRLYDEKCLKNSTTQEVEKEEENSSIINTTTSLGSTTTTTSCINTITTPLTIPTPTSTALPTTALPTTATETAATTIKFLNKENIQGQHVVSDDSGDISNNIGSSSSLKRNVYKNNLSEKNVIKASQLTFKSPTTTNNKTTTPAAAATLIKSTTTSEASQISSAFSSPQISTMITINNEIGIADIETPSATASSTLKLAKCSSSSSSSSSSSPLSLSSLSFSKSNQNVKQNHKNIKTFPENMKNKIKNNLVTIAITPTTTTKSLKSNNLAIATVVPSTLAAATVSTTSKALSTTTKAVESEMPALKVYFDQREESALAITTTAAALPTQTTIHHLGDDGADDNDGKSTKKRRRRRSNSLNLATSPPLVVNIVQVVDNNDDIRNDDKNISLSIPKIGEVILLSNDLNSIENLSSSAIATDDDGASASAVAGASSNITQLSSPSALPSSSSSLLVSTIQPKIKQELEQQQTAISTKAVAMGPAAKQQQKQTNTMKETISNDKNETRAASVSPLRASRRSRQTSQNPSEQEPANAASSSSPANPFNAKEEEKPESKMDLKVEPDTNPLADEPEDQKPQTPSANLVKRGRGRQKKTPAAPPLLPANDMPSPAGFTEKATIDSQTPPPSSTLNPERKVGRKRKQAPVEVEETSPELHLKVEDEDNDKDSNTDGKKMRRSVRLGQRFDGFKILEEETPSIPPESSASSTRPEVGSTVENEKHASRAAEKSVPKKRGRKAKIQNSIESAQEKSTTPSHSAASSSVASPSQKKSAAHGDSVVLITKRSQRRIKPTTKILENEELRYEYEAKHNTRIASGHNSSDGGFNGSIKLTINEAQFETPPHQIVPSSNKTPSTNTKQKSERSSETNGGSENSNNHHQSQEHPSGSNAIKKKLFPKQQNEMASLKEKLRLAQRTCTDFNQFMSDIKNYKPTHNKSSPDDKKLNKRQLKKLGKKKERFLKDLGLVSKATDDNSDNDNSNTDNEEFVPPKGVQIGKPSVTLRLRAAKETTPQPTIPPSIPPPASPAAVSLTSEKPNNPKLTTSNTGSNSIAGSKVAPRKVQKRQKRVTSSNHSNTICQEELSAEQLHRLNASVIPSVTSKSSSKSSPSATPKRQIKNKHFICLCHKPSNYYIRNTPENSFCCAIDNIEDQKVGCCNQMTGEVLNLVRPSQRIGYMMLCDDHRKRLNSHNCCAGCGIFCTQGKFILCKDQHFFHADCAQKFILNSPYDPQQPTSNYASPTLVLKCPHCGIDTPERTSSVTMKCQTLPVFLPSQQTNLKSSPTESITGAQIPTGAPININNNNNNTNSNKSKISSSSLGSSAAVITQHHRSTTEAIKFEQLIPESVMNVVTGQKRRNTATEFTTKELHFAIKNEDLERVAEIFASDDLKMVRRECLNGNCLHSVANSGTIQMTYLLLCNPYAQEFINVLDDDLRTPSMCAILGDRCDILNLFIQCGADLTVKGSDGKTCLHFAAKLGNLEATHLLVDNFKATKDVSTFLKFINAQDEGGWTPMVWAAELGHTDIVSYLLNNEADPDICDNDNNTVLHWATLHNEGLETIKVLLQAGADCNIQNIEGDTPLHIACRQSLTRLCITLIANGADMMLKNKSNELPYHCIPNMDTECAKTVEFNMQMRSLGPMGLRSRIVCADISNGREAYPIKALRNEHSMDQDLHMEDSNDSIWFDFRYITQSIILQNNIQIDIRVSQMRICSCLDGCSSDQCQCTGASQQNWYTSEGRLTVEFNYEDPADIFECNDVCGCNKLSCKNRIVQNGMRIPLQIIECDDTIKGWGVRTLVNIPKGSFISIYCGEILTEFEATRRTDHSYFYDLGHQNYIDAKYYGNISRFYNHSCDPNIVPVRVFYEHQDYRFPKIAFFACRDIEVGEELCYDYGDRVWSRKDYSCKCTSVNCRFNIDARDENSQSSSSLGTSTSGSTAATAGSIGSAGTNTSPTVSSSIPRLKHIQETLLSLNN